MRYRYTEEDVDLLKINYPLGNWDKNFKRFPNVSRHAINSKMHKIGVSFDYKNKSLATNFDYTNRAKWTKVEDNIIKEHIKILINNWLEL